jgi:hypothetical protein
VGLLAMVTAAAITLYATRQAVVRRRAAAVS